MRKTPIVFFTGFLFLYSLFVFWNAQAINVKKQKYTEATSIEQLCDLAFNAEVNYDSKWCVTEKTVADWVLDWVTFDYKWKEYTWDQLLNLFEKSIETKYQKLWVKIWTSTMARSKSWFYDAALLKVWWMFESKKTQDNENIKWLYSALYLTLSVWKQKAAKDYSAASTKQYNDKLIERYWTTSTVETSFIRLPWWEIVEIKASLLSTDTVTKITSDKDYQAPTPVESSKNLSRYAWTIEQLNTLLNTNKINVDINADLKSTQDIIDQWIEWMWTSWWSQSEYDAAVDARTEAFTKEFMKMSAKEQQLYRQYSSPYYWGWFMFSWSQSKEEIIKKSIEKIQIREKWPKTDSPYNWNNNDLIYWYIINDVNVWISILKDWWLTKLPIDVLKNTAIYSYYVENYFWDAQYSLNWKNNNMHWVSSEYVLWMFWYSISTDPMDPDYLVLKYDASKNQVWPSLHYIENVWKTEGK